MKTKFIWLILSCFMVAALVLASCAPAAPAIEEKPAPATEEKPAPTTGEKPAPVTEEKPAQVVDTGPQYGGVFTQVTAMEPLYFDEPSGHPAYAGTLFLTQDELYQSDYAKGLAGSKEAAYQLSILAPEDARAPRLALSYELVDENTLVLKIRQGVYFHNKAPVNGREMDAEDVVFSLRRIWANPRSIQSLAYRQDTYVESIEAPDKWTVVVESKPGMMGSIFPLVIDLCHIVPREVGEMDDTGWGFSYMSDWRNSVGTGPLMLTDYVSGSSATFVRNPNYWMKDPLHPENTLPYVDRVAYLIIPDSSTRMAALRTAKIDWMGGWLASVDWEDAAMLQKTTPQLQYSKYLPDSCAAIHWRIDKPDLPIYDVRVRRALNMAVDNQLIADTYFGGQAEIMCWPVHPIPQYKRMFTPLEEFSEVIREQFEYHPEKAKQLLAEAGYPNGFKTEIVCQSTQIDLLSIVEAYWADIGVELDIQVKESAVYNSIGLKNTHEQMFMSGLSGGLPYRFFYTAPHMNNNSMVDDPKINQAKLDCSKYWMDEAKRDQIVKETAPYQLENAYFLQLPIAYSYTFWWPWVKNYGGDTQVGYCNYDDFARFIWIDQELKKAVTGK